ncbi:MAG TPA: hypothetical protein VNM91_01070 [Dehalococcoidia bacterium]|nr:hypothetical protein [Dehalococcoidia bacterium]
MSEPQPPPPDQPLPTPGQRVSGIAVPSSYALPGKPDDRAPAALQDCYRQTQFVLGGDLRLFERGMDLQLRILNDSSHSRYRTHIYAAVVGLWSRAYATLGDALLLITRGSYASVPNLVRSAAELIAAEYQLHREERAEFIGWMLRHLKADETHKAFDVGLGHYFAGTTLAADADMRVVYRAASDFGRPNFGATLLEVGPESNNLRLAYSFADPSFHAGWAEIELGWLLRLCERQLAVAVHMRDVLNITDETHGAYATFARDVQSRLDDASRARVEEVEVDGMKRWLVHNFRRQPSGAPKKMLV